MLLVIAAVAVDASSWTDCFSMASFWEFWESYVLLQARASAVVLAITVEAAAACIVPSSSSFVVVVTVAPGGAPFIRPFHNFSLVADGRSSQSKSPIIANLSRLLLYSLLV
jgi:hypothetical protein